MNQLLKKIFYRQKIERYRYHEIEPTHSISIFVSNAEGVNQEEKISDFLTEIGFMLNVGQHPNVIKVVGCSTTEKPILLITEFLKYGDLLHFLWDAREVVTFCISWKLCEKVVLRQCYISV